MVASCQVGRQQCDQDLRAACFDLLSGESHGLVEHQMQRKKENIDAAVIAFVKEESQV